ncbi:hypothetical protein SODALDRAFT_357334 [Sodiomyces alkalinus F11]|uniref:Uncharacterized protein n=1 Tax=Sodiomyces alkalinus (strain CBS 110278 / VKM F-3762 / F11) TaxID=1314773 RepID=A0A3N2Q3K4_SODAK|nr:hypothetical protein SODALDRAFT_357334 [Sodiomyces alkalinus F11]ROT41297.1 hypothetical protein SODALDRAFT_357334 [Sodiomyces alkalinus F11]
MSMALAIWPVSLHLDILANSQTVYLDRENGHIRFTYVTAIPGPKEDLRTNELCRSLRSQFRLAGIVSSKYGYKFTEVRINMNTTCPFSTYLRSAVWLLCRSTTYVIVNLMVVLRVNHVSEYGFGSKEHMPPSLPSFTFTIMSVPGCQSDRSDLRLVPDDAPMTRYGYVGRLNPSGIA